MNIPTPFPEHNEFMHVSQVIDLAAASANAGPKIQSAANLRTKFFTAINFIVPRYIAEGCTILAGRPKLGKSWLMLDIGLAVAMGGTCLGVQCAEADVLYLALEDNERRLQSRITKLLGAFNQWPSRFTYATDWPRADHGGLKHIEAWLEAADKPGLIVIDVLAAFRSPRPERQNTYDGDYAAIQGLQQLASKYKVAIVIVHHVRKSLAEVDPFEKVSGTFGLSGAADTVMILDRDSNGTAIYARGRDIEEIETAVTFDPGTCRWTVLGEVAEVRRSDERSVILTALRKATTPMTPKELSDATKMPSDNVRQLLGKMVTAGEITKTKRGLYTSPDHNDHKITNDDD